MLQFTPAYFFYDEPNLAKKHCSENAPLINSATMLESPVLHFNGKKKKSCLIEHIFKPNQIYQSTIKTHTAVSHFKFPIDHSDEY